MRFVFLGSPPFATPVLERLLASPFRPELVVTPAPRPRGRGRRIERSPVAALAEDAGVAVLQPRTVRDEDVLARLRAVEADVFLVVSYGELLRREFLDIPRLECLNVHPSLLPRWRGASPIQAAILAGDRHTGVSIQRVVLELDAGDVLAARRTAILPGETAGELAERLAVLAGEVVLEALEAVASDAAEFTPQDEGAVTLCKRMKKEDGRVDWARDAVELERLVRAMNPWPGARTTLPDGHELSIWRARVVAPVPQAPPGADASPGTLLEAGARLTVACGLGGSGALELLEVQAAGKRALAAADFLRGARLTAGERLGPET